MLGIKKLKNGHIIIFYLRLYLIFNKERLSIECLTETKPKEALKPIRRKQNVTWSEWKLKVIKNKQSAQSAGKRGWPNGNRC